MIEALMYNPKAILVAIAVVMAIVVIVALRWKPQQKPFPRPSADPDENSIEMDELEKEASMVMQAEIADPHTQLPRHATRSLSKSTAAISATLLWEANQSIAAEEERQRSKEWNWGKDPAF